MILALWLVLLAIFFGSYALFLGHLKLHAGRPWNLKIDPEYCPDVTILVPAHNEELRIKEKLENLAEVTYPKEKTEVIVIDDGSTDQTSAKANDFAKDHPELSVKILQQNPRKGKAWALNKALHVSSNDIIVITDVDTTWPQDILSKALPYMSDPKIGAVTGLGAVANAAQSWLTRSESRYMSLMSVIRLGESKVHSTILFEGAMCAFKREAFDQFDTESGADDSGTALEIVQNNFRTILAPEACAFAEVHNTFRKRTNAKLRRALHLNGLYLKCFKLLCAGRLAMPKRIALPEIFIRIINPLVFITLVCATLALIAYYPIALFVLILILGVVSLIPKTRTVILTGILDQFILFYSVILLFRKKRVIAWDR